MTISAEQLQATAHRHPIVEVPLQIDRRRARGVEDASFVIGRIEIGVARPAGLIKARGGDAVGGVGRIWHPANEMPSSSSLSDWLFSMCQQFCCGSSG